MRAILFFSFIIGASCIFDSLKLWDKKDESSEEADLSYAYSPAESVAGVFSHARQLKGRKSSKRRSGKSSYKKPKSSYYKPTKKKVTKKTTTTKTYTKKTYTKKTTTKKKSYSSKYKTDYRSSNSYWNAGLGRTY